jgi:hypothetical protein
MAITIEPIGGLPGCIAPATHCSRLPRTTRTAAARKVLPA